MRIPQSTADTIIAAMQDFDLNKRDGEEWADWVQNKNHKFAILWADKVYPVKEIIRVATGFKSFSGGDGITAANPYIKSLGFDIVSLDDGYRLKKKRNPAWHRDELILALDLYFRHHPSKINKNHKEVVALSAVLNSLSTHLNRPDYEKFRNPNGVYMKLGNFLRFDPSYRGKGLEAGGKLEEEVWNEFVGDQEKLRSAVEFIRLGIEVDLIKTLMVEQPPGDIIAAFNHERKHRGERELEVSVLEMSDEDFSKYINNLDTNAGLEVRESLVKTRKYNKKIIEDLKERYYYRCQICGYDSMDKYGVSVVEGHHIEEFSLTQNNKPENILIVCPNHHRLIHNEKGVFDRKQLQIVYYNGAVELIDINSHL